MTRVRAGCGAVSTTPGGVPSTGWPWCWTSIHHALPRAQRPGQARPRTVCVLPRAAEIPLHRQGGLPPVLRRRGGQPRTATPGLWRGGLRRGPGSGGGSVWPLGHFPGQGCLCHAGEPPLPGLNYEGGRRVRPAVGLRQGRAPVGEPPVQSPGGRGGEGGPVGLPHAGHRPDVDRPPIPVVCRCVCPVPQTVVAPAGPARVPPGGGMDMMPAPRW